MYQSRKKFKYNRATSAGVPALSLRVISKQYYYTVTDRSFPTTYFRFRDVAIRLIILQPTRRGSARVEQSEISFRSPLAPPTLRVNIAVVVVSNNNARDDSGFSGTFSIIYFTFSGRSRVRKSKHNDHRRQVGTSIIRPGERTRPGNASERRE